MSPRARPDQREILRRTSRTFALSITALPRALRRPVEVAYLLARTADTIADTEIAAGESRRALLAQLRGAVVEDAEAPLDPIAQLGRRGSRDQQRQSQAEGELLSRVELLLERYRSLPAEDRRDVRDVVARLIQTMEGELAWRESTDRIAVMPDAHALTRYTEGIAGCVGLFWTRLVVRHRRPRGASPWLALETEGRRYGRGLQLVNILRDLPRDLRRGCCFLPADELAALGLTPADLLDRRTAPRLRPLLARWQLRARWNLMAGIVYTSRLPKRAYSLRLSTSLPAALGLATLDRLSYGCERLDPEIVIRVPRRELRGLVLLVGLRSATTGGLRKLARRSRFG